MPRERIARARTSGRVRPEWVDRRSRRLLGAAVLVLAPLGFVVPGASAEPIAAGSASAFGGEVTLGGEEVIVEPTVAVDAPDGDDEATTIDIPADPLAVSGTLTARANVHTSSDIESGLTVVEHEVAGPYNVRGLGEVENAQVLLDAVAEDVPLLSAALIRAEAVAVCTADTVQYSATSEIVDLRIGGEEVPLNAPVSDLVDGISGVLADSGLQAVVDVQRDVVTEGADGGLAVDALVVTVLDAAGENPLGQVRLAHAEVGAAGCSEPPPACSDGADNDGDGRIDAEDPGCHTDGDADNADSYDPDDDSEADPECSDVVDNDGDGVADQEDPGCHTDGDADNPDSYDPLDDSEQDTTVSERRLPSTGGALSGLAVAGLTAGGIATFVLRRRM